MKIRPVSAELFNADGRSRHGGYSLICERASEYCWFSGAVWRTRCVRCFSRINVTQYGSVEQVERGMP